MGFTFATTSFAAITGFSAAQMFGAATTTIDTFGAGLIVTFAYSAPYIAAALMILTVMAFIFAISKAFIV